MAQKASANLKRKYSRTLLDLNKAPMRIIPQNNRVDCTLYHFHNALLSCSSIVANVQAPRCILPQRDFHIIYQENFRAPILGSDLISLLPKL